MAISAKPERISEEISARLHYTKSPEIDDFTLHRYLQTLMKLKKESVFTEIDYIALGKVLFNLKEHDKFINILEEGLHNYQSIKILENLIMGKLYLVNEKYKMKKALDFYHEWFSHPINQIGSPLNIIIHLKRIFFDDKTLYPQKDICGSLKIYHNFQCNIEIGPFCVTEDFRGLAENGMDFFTPILEEYIDKCLEGSLDQIEKDFFMEMLGKEQFDFLAALIEKSEIEDINDVVSTERHIEKEGFQGLKKYCEYQEARS